MQVRVPAGRSTIVELPVCSHGPWAAGFRSNVRGFLGDHAVSVQAGVPRFVPGACHTRAGQVPPAKVVPGEAA